jgi:hypothetical protein
VEGRCNAIAPGFLALVSPLGGGLPHQEVCHMAELTEKKRDSLKKSQFGLPEEKKYPMPDKSHARNAKARASQQKKKGTITASEKAKIDRKADRILDK